MASVRRMHESEPEDNPETVRDMFTGELIRVGAVRSNVYLTDDDPVAIHHYRREVAVSFTSLPTLGELIGDCVVDHCTAADEANPQDPVALVDKALDAVRQAAYKAILRQSKLTGTHEPKPKKPKKPAKKKRKVTKYECGCCGDAYAGDEICEDCGFCEECGHDGDCELDC